ncbi:MAG: DUF3999 family protein, partial [Rhodoferax sp.]
MRLKSSLRAATHWVAGVLIVISTGVMAADAPQPADFTWRATLTPPIGASLARIDVPVQALLGMRSGSANDVRVFNAAGAVVPFALLGGADLRRAAPFAQTTSYKAYQLYAANSPEGKPARGTVQVHVDSGDQQGSAWVRWDRPDMKTSAIDAAAQPLQAALFDMRAEKQNLGALDLVVDLPHNALVHMAVATSTDLIEWTPVATKGPLFQFDGGDAPANSVLELVQPLHVQDRYLRLAWPGQNGVKLRALTGNIAASQTVAPPLRADLPPGTLDGNNALKWNLPFATPIAALHLHAVQNNSLVPVRILGRGDAAQPWRMLASTIVYRLDGAGQSGSNPPTALRAASLQSLRVEVGKGMALPDGGLQAAVEFAPVQVAFLASGAGPFTLAVGRPQTSAAAV